VIYLYLIMVSFNIAMLILSLVGGLPLANILIWFVAAFFWSGATYMRYKSRSS
jgi:hypothetical protein